MQWMKWRMERWDDGKISFLEFCWTGGNFIKYKWNLKQKARKSTEQSSEKIKRGKHP
jgi:hypothetical protein